MCTRGIIFFSFGHQNGLGAAELYRDHVALKSQERAMGLSMQYHSPAALRAFPLLVTEVAMSKGGKINYVLYLPHLTET